jgi:hypothetical protein
MHFRDSNEYFGPWHQPNSTYLHRKSGRLFEYSFNAVGARDRERSTHSDVPRAVMLGDSFIEGYALQTEDRLSNLLEKWSEMEVLNFGVAGNTGTVQYYLIYKYLASQFDHSYVLVGILPANDFSDNDYSLGLDTMTFRYRPYAIGVYPHYDIIYYNKAFLDSRGAAYPWSVVVRSLLVNFSMTYRTASYVKQIVRSQRGGGANYSGYYDFTHDDWDKMRWSLERLCQLAHEKQTKVFMFTIPVWSDVVRYRSEHRAPLAEKFEDLALAIGFTYVDLLPGFAANCAQTTQGDLPSLWLKNDGHWTAEGNRLALELLKPALAGVGIRPASER